MSRLTNTEENRKGTDPFSYWLKDSHPLEQLKAFKKLASYEDKEEQELLIELPVAEGTRVWTIVTGMTGKHPTLLRQDFELSMLRHWGTAVFATRSEAEEALAKMGR